MHEILFITGNTKKVESANVALEGKNIKLIQHRLDCPEIQDTDIKKVAEYSAQFACEKLNKPVVKVDVGFEIEALNGFPGPFLKFINSWLSPEKIITLLSGEENLSAKFIDVVAYCKPGSEPVSFLSETKGKLTKIVNGEGGWGVDKIFIPDGYSKTLASLTDSERVLVWNQNHWHELANYLDLKKK